MKFIGYTECAREKKKINKNGSNSYRNLIKMFPISPSTSSRERRKKKVNYLQILLSFFFIFYIFIYRFLIRFFFLLFFIFHKEFWFWRKTQTVCVFLVWSRENRMFSCYIRVKANLIWFMTILWGLVAVKF